MTGARERLEAAMSAQHGCDTLLSTSGRPCNRCCQSAKALLPVVQRIADERAADVLEQAASEIEGTDDDVVARALRRVCSEDTLRNRAASLRAAGSREETGR